MVGLFSSLVVLLSTSSCFSIPFSKPGDAGVATIQAELSSVSEHVTAVLECILNIPDVGVTLTTALDIHTECVSLDESIRNVTKTVKSTIPGVLNTTDAECIVEALENIKCEISTLLTEVEKKKSVLDSLPVLPLLNLSVLLKVDLKNLDICTDDLEDAVMRILPTGKLIERVTEIKSVLGPAFGQAIAMYS